MEGEGGKRKAESRFSPFFLPPFGPHPRFRSPPRRLAPTIPRVAASAGRFRRRSSAREPHGGTGRERTARPVAHRGQYSAGRCLGERGKRKFRKRKVPHCSLSSAAKMWEMVSSK